MSQPASFSLAIAGFGVQVNCNHAPLAETLRDYYKAFPSTTEPRLTIELEWAGEERNSPLMDTGTTFQEGVLHFTAPGYQGFIDENAGRGALTLSSAYPLEDVDYYLRVAYALLAHAAGGVLLHTAGIVRDGQAYLFFGHSGSGKTTACRVSAEMCAILNDDLILMLPEADGWRAYGTPFWNPTQVKPSPEHALVAGAYLLVQDKQVFAQGLARSRAMVSLIANVPVIPQDAQRSAALWEILSKFRQEVPVQELHFLPDNSFWGVIPG